jgi:hypothetical protein
MGHEICSLFVLFVRISFRFFPLEYLVRWSLVSSFYWYFPSKDQGYQISESRHLVIPRSGLRTLGAHGDFFLVLDSFVFIKT